MAKHNLKCEFLFFFCFPLFYIIVNWISLGFGLLVEQKLQWDLVLWELFLFFSDIDIKVLALGVYLKTRMTIAYKQSIPEAMETTKQRLSTLTTHLSKFTGELSGRVIIQKQIHPGLRVNSTGRTYGRRRHHITPMLSCQGIKEQIIAISQNKIK